MKQQLSDNESIRIPRATYDLLIEAFEMLCYMWGPADDIPDVDEMQEDYENLKAKVEEALRSAK